MPRYRFEFSEDQAKSAVVVDLSGDEEAHKEALRTSTQIVADAAANELDPAGWSVTVYDETDKALFRVTLDNTHLG